MCLRVKVWDFGLRVWVLGFRALGPGDPDTFRLLQNGFRRSL